MRFEIFEDLYKLWHLFGGISNVTPDVFVLKIGNLST
jgi:hypothetical protein